MHASAMSTQIKGQKCQDQTRSRYELAGPRKGERRQKRLVLMLIELQRKRLIELVWLSSSCTYAWTIKSTIRALNQQVVLALLD